MNLDKINGSCSGKSLFTHYYYSLTSKKIILKSNFHAMIYINKFAEMNANSETIFNSDCAQDFKETFQPFLANFLILYQRFSGVFCGCKMGTLARNGIKSQKEALRKFSFLLICGFTGHHDQASSYFYRDLEAVVRRCSSKQVFLQDCNFIKKKVQHSFFLP